MKAMRKLIPALAMLLIAATVTTASSFAWFSMNKTVTATGMSVKTTVSSNLLIAADEITSTEKKGEANFGTSLTQTVTGTLEPVSTVDGEDFFYTVDALADGSKVTTAAYKAYTQTALANDYAVTGAVGYVDYVFQLKVVNIESTAQDLKLTGLTLTYQNTAATETDTNKAYRVAVFAEDITSTAPAGGVGDLIGIYTPTGAANQEEGKAVNATTGTGAVTYNAATRLASVDATSTEYYKVVVRLYLEGEDTTCTNATFLELTKDWNLDIEISIDSTKTAVDKITMARNVIA